MCIIMVKPAGVKYPAEETIRRCFTINSDGAGYMFSRNNKVVIRKGFMHMYDLIKDLENNTTHEDSVVVHFRMATHGQKDEGNCHPFPLSADISELRATRISCDVGLAHNGVFHINIPNKKLSDTQAFVQVVAAKPAVLTKKDHPFRPIMDMAVSGSRLAVMQSDGNVALFGTGWVKEGSLYFSNSGYKAYRQTTYSYGYGAYGQVDNSSHGTWYGKSEPRGVQLLPAKKAKKAKKEKKGKAVVLSDLIKKAISEKKKEEEAELKHEEQEGYQNVYDCPICGDWVIRGKCYSCDFDEDMTDDEYYELIGEWYDKNNTSPIINAGVDS